MAPNKTIQKGIFWVSASPMGSWFPNFSLGRFPVTCYHSLRALHQHYYNHWTYYGGIAAQISILGMKMDWDEYAGIPVMALCKMLLFQGKLDGRLYWRHRIEHIQISLAVTNPCQNSKISRWRNDLWSVHQSSSRIARCWWSCNRIAVYRGAVPVLIRAIKVKSHKIIWASTSFYVGFYGVHTAYGGRFSLQNEKNPDPASVGWLGFGSFCFGVTKKKNSLTDGRER
jgi:hypothetical protein